MTYICVSGITIIGSDNGLSPGRRQAIIWSNAGILLIEALEKKLQWNSYRNYSIFIQENALECVVCEMTTILSRPQCVKPNCTVVSDFLSQMKLNSTRSMILLVQLRIDTELGPNFNSSYGLCFTHDDVMTWRCFPHYWSFIRNPLRYGESLIKLLTTNQIDVRCIKAWVMHTYEVYAEYFREPQFKSVGPPEISRVTWQIWWCDCNGL